MISKYVLILYLCSLTAQQCDSGMITAYEFNDHYDCAVAGYDMSHKTMQMMDRDLVNKDELAIKFECKQVRIDKT